MRCDSVHHARRKHQRCPRVDCDRDTKRVGDLLGAGPILQRRIHVRGDAAVALPRHGDRQRNQLPRLGVKAPTGSWGLREFAIARSVPGGSGPRSPIAFSN